MSPPGPAALSVWLYRRLLGAYPREFRQEYGEAMAQVFYDLCLRGGRAGLARAWGRTLPDYAVSLVSEHMNRGVEMTKSKWIQLSGWGLAASGFLLMAGLAASGRPAYNPHNAAAWPIDPFLNAADFIMAVTGLLLLGAGMAGLLARFGRRSGWLGRLGLAIGAGAALVSAAGAAGLQVVDASPWWDMFITGLGASCMGLALFGAAALRERPFRRWNGLPLAVGLLLPVLMLLSFGLVPMVVPLSTALAVFIIFSAGLALVGYRLQSEAAEGLSAGAV